MFCLSLRTVLNDSHFWILTFAPFISSTCYSDVFFTHALLCNSVNCTKYTFILVKTRVQRKQNNDWNTFYSWCSFFLTHKSLIFLSGIYIYFLGGMHFVCLLFVLRHLPALCVYSTKYRQCYFRFLFCCGFLVHERKHPLQIFFFFFFFFTVR